MSLDFSSSPRIGGGKAHAKILYFDQTENFREGAAFKTDFIRLHEMGFEENEWHEFSNIFYVPKDAVMARIMFLGNRIEDDNSQALFFVDNVKFRKIFELKNKIILQGQERYFTYVSQVCNVHPGSMYELEISFMGNRLTDTHAKVNWYDQTENFSEGAYHKLDLVKLYEMGLEENEWHIVRKVLRAPENAIAARVFLLGGRSATGKEVLTIADQLSFYELKPTVEISNYLEESAKIVSYERINPTEYKIRVKAQAPFLLSFIEKYDQGWSAYVNGKEYKSIPLYSTINGFQIEETGELDVTIEYKPQCVFGLASMVGILCLVVCIAYLCKDPLKNLRSKFTGKRVHPNRKGG